MYLGIDLGTSNSAIVASLRHLMGRMYSPVRSCLIAVEACWSGKEPTTSQHFHQKMLRKGSNV